MYDKEEIMRFVKKLFIPILLALSCLFLATGLFFGIAGYKTPTVAYADEPFVLQGASVRAASSF